VAAAEGRREERRLGGECSTKSDRARLGRGVESAMPVWLHAGALTLVLFPGPKIQKGYTKLYRF
jgi:hypothetical protein